MPYAVCHLPSKEVRFTVLSEDELTMDLTDCLVTEIPQDLVGQPLSWNGESDPVLNLEHWWKLLRSRRDEILASTDKYVLPDYPITEEVRQAWISYRAELRSLPENTTDPRDPVWPAPPLS